MLILDICDSNKVLECSKVLKSILDKLPSLLISQLVQTKYFQPKLAPEQKGEAKEDSHSLNSANQNSIDFSIASEDYYTSRSKERETQRTVLSYLFLPELCEVILPKLDETLLSSRLILDELRYYLVSENFSTGHGRLAIDNTSMNPHIKLLLHFPKLLQSYCQFLATPAKQWFLNELIKYMTALTLEPAFDCSLLILVDALDTNTTYEHLPILFNKIVATNHSAVIDKFLDFFFIQLNILSPLFSSETDIAFQRFIRILALYVVQPYNPALSFDFLNRYPATYFDFAVDYLIQLDARCWYLNPKIYEKMLEKASTEAIQRWMRHEPTQMRALSYPLSGLNSAFALMILKPLLIKNISVFNIPCYQRLWDELYNRTYHADYPTIRLIIDFQTSRFRWPSLFRRGLNRITPATVFNHPLLLEIYDKAVTHVLQTNDVPGIHLWLRLIEKLLGSEIINIPNNNLVSFILMRVRLRERLLAQKPKLIFDIRNDIIDTEEIEVKLSSEDRITYSHFYQTYYPDDLDSQKKSLTLLSEGAAQGDTKAFDTLRQRVSEISGVKIPNQRFDRYVDLALEKLSHDNLNEHIKKIESALEALVEEKPQRPSFFCASPIHPLKKYCLLLKECTDPFLKRVVVLATLKAASTKDKAIFQKTTSPLENLEDIYHAAALRYFTQHGLDAENAQTLLNPFLGTLESRFFSIKEVHAKLTLLQRGLENLKNRRTNDEQKAQVAENSQPLLENSPVLPVEDNEFLFEPRPSH